MRNTILKKERYKIGRSLRIKLRYFSDEETINNNYNNDDDVEKGEERKKKSKNKNK